jgi:Ca2+-binding RTX toxin-like protein
MSPNTPPVLSDDLVELLSRGRAQAPEADRALRPLESSNGGPVGEASQVLAHAYMPGSAQQTGQEGAAEAGTSTFTLAESGLQDAIAPQVKETVRIEASDAALAQLAQELALEQVATEGPARAASIEDPIAPDSEPSATPGALSMEILGVREKAPQAAIETGSAPNLAVPPADPVTSPSAPTPVAPAGTDVSADMSGVMAQSEESDAFDVTDPLDIDAAANSIAENVAAGTAVGIVAHAIDADATRNTVGYSVDDSRFSVDADGTVRVAAGASFDFEAEPAITLNITATSADGSTASSSFSLDVTDFDEFDVSAPVDINATANSIAENVAAGTAVGIVARATDADASNNVVSYSIDDSRFTIAADGTVRVAAGASFDFEAESAITLNITATSSDGSTASSSISLGVTDFDEFDVTAPVDINAAANSIAENAAAGTLVGIKVEAADADATTNSVSYSVNDSRFSVDADGTVRVAAGASFSYETEPGVTLNITATSSDGSSATSAFTVAVTDVAENIMLGNGNDSFTDTGTQELSVDGGRGNDTLIGSAGNDRLLGGTGADTLTGGGGNDVLSGGGESSVRLNSSGTGDGFTTGAFPDFPVNALTIEVRLTLEDATPVGVPLFSYASSLTDNALLLMGNESTMTLYVAAGAINIPVGLVSINDGAEHSLALSWNQADGKFKLYIDGSVAHSGAIGAGADIGAGGHLVFGQEQDALSGGFNPDQILQGTLHEARVWNRVLADGEVAAHHDTPLANPPGQPGLLANWVFDDADTVVDLAGDHDLTGFGSPVPTDGSGVSSVDTAVFSGNRADYAVSYDATTGLYTITDLRPGSPDGTDTLDGMEVAAFNDGSFSVALLNNSAPTDVSCSTAPILEDVSSAGSIGSTNVNAGRTVATLSAIDPDSGETFTYSIVDGDAAKYEIWGDQVRVRSGVQLDFETDASDSLTIRVTDSQGATFDKVINLSISDYEASATGTTGNDTITGTSEEDSIDGGEGNDSLTGGSGNDSITGGLGSDTLSGGTGDDVLIDMDDVAGANGDAGNDSISLNLSTISGGSSWIRGGAGNDQLTLNFANVTLTNKTIAGDSDTSGTNRDLANATDGNDSIIVSGTWTAAGNTIVLLNDGADYYRNDSTTSGFAVHAGQGNDEIIGGNGASESISGGGGDDRITGRAGNDTIDGGTGTDTAIYRGNASQYTVSMNTSTGALTLVDGTSGRDGNDVVSNVERFQFSDTTLVITNGSDATADVLTNTGGKTILSGLAGNDTLTAGSNGDILFGGAGNDTLTGGAGNDTLDGGLGNDTLVLSGNASEYRFSTGVSGYVVVTDLVAGRDGVDNVAGIETFRFSDGSFAVVSGNSGSNASLAANAAAPSIVLGLEGDDTILASVQREVMMGGTANDTLSYSGDTAGVAIDLELNTASGGRAEGDVIAQFRNVVGGSGNDTLVGNTSSNTLTGGAGNDQLFGGDGNDTLNGGTGADSMDGGQDADTVDYASSTGAVNINLTAQTASGGDAAGDTISGIESAIGGSGNDIITGDSGGNTLTGNAGNDTIDGAGGNDLIEGGLGSDILSGGAGTGDYVSYATSNAGVVVNLSAQTVSGGHAQGDTISGFEHVIGSGSADTVTGDGGSNTIQAGSGNDQIYGLDGNDTLYGQAGVDIIEGGAGNDIIDGGAGADNLAGGDGIDTLNYGSSGAVTVSLLAGTASGGEATGDIFSGFENLTGSNYADTLTGDAGDNVLIGNYGNDILEGGGGNDTLNGHLDIDTASYQSASSGVTVNLAITTAQATGGAGTDTLINIENLTGSGFNDTLTGDTGANTISGGAGNDTINGAAGIDRLVGGAGDDRLDGGADTDTAVFSGSVAQYSFSRDGSGNVVVSDSVAGRDGVDTLSTVENLEFGGNSFSLTSSTTAATVSEAATAGTQVGQVLSGASYSVSDARFSVDSAGRVRLAAGASLDYEAQSTVSFNVTAVRGSSIVVSRLDLALQDVDEFDVTAPVDGDAGSNSIAENATAGTAVGILVQAVDADGSNNSISYSSSDSRFSVDADGTVRVATGARFDFETESSINLRINAASSDGSTASSEFTLQVGDAPEGSYDRTNVLTSGNDSHWAGAGNDHISGLAGNDSIGGGDGDDYIAGGRGNDSLHGQSGNDTLLGEDGNDVLYGYEGNDSLSGGSGNDELHGNAGSDTLGGGDGNDVLYAHDGDDVLTGGAGVDQLYGDAGNDSLSGGDGNDLLYAHDGDDTLSGGAGDDRMFAGDGSDILYASSQSGMDDFDGGAGGGWIDTIQIDHATPAGQTLPWDIQVNGVSLSLDPNSNGIDLGQDVSGSLVFDDGSSISFDNVERIAW